MKPIPLLLPLLLPLLSFGADAHAVLPASGPAPVGPYSPGVVVGEYLYLSGQGAHRPDGSVPDTFAEQVRQTLENVKAVLEAGGLTMEHIVYTQVYLDGFKSSGQRDSGHCSGYQAAPKRMAGRSAAADATGKMAHSSAKPAINCLCGITRYSNVRRHALRPASRASQSLPRLERREIAGHSASTPPFRSLNRR